MMDFSTILWDVTDGVATITLNRPERLNSFTETMHAELRVALDRVETPGVARVLILTGAGRGFSAGQDLSDAMDKSGAIHFDAGSSLEKNYNVMLTRLRALPMPVIAARSASFLQAFARIGLIPDAGGTHSLVHRIGLQRAMGLAMLAEPLPAETAAQWGLIWKCVDDDRLADEVQTLARKLASGPTHAYALMKRAIYAGADNNFEQQLALEVVLQREAGMSADFREGVAAFLGKRPPVFTGK